MYSGPLRSLTNRRRLPPGSSRSTLTRASDPLLPVAVGDPVIGRVANSVRRRTVGAGCAAANAAASVMTTAQASKRVTRVDLACNLAPTTAAPANKKGTEDDASVPPYVSYAPYVIYVIY